MESRKQRMDRFSKFVIKKIDRILRVVLLVNHTPNYIFKYYDKKYHFTCDVAANRWNTKCKKYFTKKDNALYQPWSGVCWMASPWCEFRSWLIKAVLESSKGVTVVGIFPYFPELIGQYSILGKYYETKIFHDCQFGILNKKYKYDVIGIVFKNGKNGQNS